MFAQLAWQSGESIPSVGSPWFLFCFVWFVWKFVSCVSEVKLFLLVHFFSHQFQVGFFFLKGCESKSSVLTELVGGCGEFYFSMPLF